MAKAKTTETPGSVPDFIHSLKDPEREKDCFLIADIMKEQSGFQPKMWGPAIVGFGSYHYKYASGHEGDAPLVGFSPRKAAISLYLASAFENKDELLAKFGKHRSGSGCIYIKRLSDIDADVLKEMIKNSITHIEKLHR